MFACGLMNKDTEIKKINFEIKDCTKCRLSETRKNSLPGEGNLDARIILIAQAPGKNEDVEGEMFIGPSGKVLDRLLQNAKADGEKIYMTNLVKCMLPRYRRPKRDEIETCSRYLDKEIEIIKPKFLVPMGFYSTRYIFEKYGFDIPEKKEFRNVYGKLFYKKGMKIYPVQHPASVLYRSELESILQKNYDKLKIFEKNCKWYQMCPMKMFYEKGMLDRKWVELYCKGDWESCKRYKMEEEGKFHPDYMLPDGSINEKLKK